MALHTADPGAGGGQTTSEASYPGYSREAVARDGTAWTVSDLIATLDVEVSFGEATGGTETVTHFSIGVSASGAGMVLYSGALVDAVGDPDSIEVTAGVRPIVKTGSTISFAAA